MSIGDAIVKVWCDEPGCKCEEEIGLTALVRNSYDIRNVESELKSLGWKIDGDKTICDCHEEE